MVLFSKEKECPNCRNIVFKKDMVYYAVSLGEDYETTKMIKICRDCAMEKFYEVLLNYNDSLAIVSPLNEKRYNSYCSYNFDECIKMERGQSLNRVDQMTVDLVNEFKSRLPKEGTKCNRCKNEAKHALFESCALENPFQWILNTDARYEYLCPECTVKAFKEVLENEQMIIKDGLISPGKGQGFMCSGEI